MKHVKYYYCADLQDADLHFMEAIIDTCVQAALFAG